VDNCPYADLTGTPITYARQISLSAMQSGEDSLFPGEHYKNLGRFLMSAFVARQQEAEAESVDTEAPSFLTLHRFNRRGDDRIMHFNSLKQFDALTTNEQENDSSSQLVYLSGYPSARWLCRIGSHYDIDPEFFYRHLDFPSSIDVRM
jgi:hypothetical protein